jgi:chromosome segregation ATPase
MPKPAARDLDLDEPLSELVHARQRLRGLDGQIAGSERDLAEFRRQRGELAKEIANRAQALKIAHAKGDFFAWAGDAAGD